MPHDEISSAYDRWASSYDSDRNATRDLDAAVLRSSGLELKNRIIVELGCGTGKNTPWLAEQAARVIAFDFSDGMLARARERLGDSAARVDLIRQDLTDAWPLDDASVDVVVGNLVLEHVRDVSHVFAETARVLRHGGEMYLSELHPLRQSRGGQAQFTDGNSGERVYVPAFVHTVDEFRAAAHAAGLAEIGLSDHTEPGSTAETPRLIVMRWSK